MKEKIQHPSIIAAFIGGIFLLLSLCISNRQAKNQVKTSDRKLLIDKRIELIDKTAKIFYRLPATEKLYDYGIYKNIDISFFDDNNKQIILPKNLAVSREMGEHRSEFSAILIQDRLYFGRETEQYIKDSLQVDNTYFWNIPQNKYERLIEIMESELFIEK